MGKINPLLDENPKPDTPKTEEKPKAKRGRKPKVKPIETPTESPTEPEKAPRKKRVIRRKRRSASGTVLFSLEDGKLQAVRIVPFVLRPINKKELHPKAQSILSLWNRNKNLFNK
jgi:hypothetical protein